MDVYQGHEGVSKPRELVQAISKSDLVQLDKCRARMDCNNRPPGAAHISLICALTPWVAMPAFEAASITAVCASRTSPPKSWRWQEQARIHRDPALQFVGRSVGEIELDGVVYPSFKGGLGQVDAMRALADAGKSLQLVDGLGRIWGAWVITEIGDTRTVFADDGQPRKLEFRIKLKAYGEDQP